VGRISTSLATIDAFEFDGERLDGLIELIGEGVALGCLRLAQGVAEAIEGPSEGGCLVSWERVVQGRQSGRGEALGEADVVGVVVGP